MYWRLVFKKKTPNNTKVTPGFNVRKSTFYTSSPQKRKEVKEIFKNKNYHLVVDEWHDEELPRGYEDKEIVTAPYWVTSFTSSNDILFKEVEKQKKILQKNASLITPSTKQSVGCKHIYNCPEHLKKCVTKKGLRPITTKFPSKIEAMQI